MEQRDVVNALVTLLRENPSEWARYGTDDVDLTNKKRRIQIVVFFGWFTVRVDYGNGQLWLSRLNSWRLRRAVKKWHRGVRGAGAQATLNELFLEATK